VQPGQQLPVDDEYLSSAIERLLAFGILLVSGAWLQLRKNDQAPALSWLTSRLEGVTADGHLQTAG
jgi:hypothetical protein